jgi:hypothetical protein
VRDHVRRRALHAGAALQVADRLAHGAPVADLHDLRARRDVLLHGHVRGDGLRRVGRHADDDLARHMVGRARRRREAGKGKGGE